MSIEGCRPFRLLCMTKMWNLEVEFVLVPSPHQNPCLLDESWVGCKKGIKRSPCLGCPAAAIGLKYRFDMADE